MKKVLFVILAIVIPPLAVGLLEGFGKHFWINLVLWLLSCTVLGVIHALYLIFTKDYPAFHG